MNVCVVGAQWGDEGKGKVVDLYSAQAEYIVRYQGGNNAGHTLVVGGKKTVLHLIPSGILHEGRVCLIANGVVFDPEVFFTEVDALIAAGVLTEQSASDRIRVSERAHIILPFHRLIDRMREEHASKSQSKIGTTVRGIGPAYEDKVARRGIQVGDFLRRELLEIKISRSIEEKNVLLEHHFKSPERITVKAMMDHCDKLAARLKPYIADTRASLVHAMTQKRPILFEGAQGTLLDVDHGTYPYVTSSNTISGGALTGAGVGPRAFEHVIGIAKAYTTRVGVGPFPTEIETTEKETAEFIRKKGAEFGATTGRPRRVGWLDLVALKYAVEVNGLTGIALMKSDVLSGLESVKLCHSYSLGGNSHYELPSSIEDFDRLVPQYEVLPGWEDFNAANIRSRGDLPRELQIFLERIEDTLRTPIVLFSMGPGREDTLILKDVF